MKALGSLCLVVASAFVLIAASRTTAADAAVIGYLCGAIMVTGVVAVNRRDRR